MRDGFDELGEDRGGVRLGEGCGGENAVVEGGFLAEIGDDEEMSIGIKQSVDLDDVRVRREKVEDLRLLDETVAVGRVVGEEAFVDDLHGVGGERRDGEAAVYDTETAATDLLAKLVLSLKTLAHYISLFLSAFSPLKILCRVVMDVGGMENCFEIHVPFCIICLFGRFPFVWWVFLEGMTR